MSDFTYRDADASVHAPMRKIGTMSSSPWRMPKWSAMYPMSRSTSTPGTTNSDDIEYPSDLTFGGMQRLSDAKMPGASSATMPEMRMFIAIASHRTGVSAKSMNAP